MTASALLVALLPVAWLLPNHYPPWLSAWQEGVAFALLFAAAVVHRAGWQLPRRWAALVALAAASVLVQWSTGLMHFFGDAWITGLYLAGLLFAIALGASLQAADSARKGWTWLESMALVAVAAGVLSVGIALVQWTGVFSMGIWGAELRPGGRPYANVAQPNHLCTLSFWSLCSVAVLLERGRVGRFGAALAAAMLVLGMVISGSRTGWLQMAGLLVVGLAFAPRMGARVGGPAVVAVSVLFVGLSLAWPSLNTVAVELPSRGAMPAVQGDLRWPLWQALAAAIAERPLTGYGWQQLAWAQQAVALDAAPVQRYFEHAHNLVLDLLVWCGVPLALLLLIGGAWALAKPLPRLQDPPLFWMLVAVLGVLVHAGLEYPHGYAYFLLPMGLVVGAVQAAVQPSACWHVARPLAWPVAATAAAAFVLTSVDYLQAEQNHRMLRFDSARIGTARVASAPPDLRVLTQLQAFLEAAREPSVPGMDPLALQRLRQVSQRFGYAPVMFRRAVAEGLNGQPDEARLVLRQLCSVQQPDRCDEGRRAWADLQTRHPELAHIEYPPTPATIR